MTVDEFKNQLAALNSEMTVADMRRRIEVLEEARKNARADADKWALESATQAARAEAAEAALAAVPVDALRRTLFTGYRTDAQITADADAINVWLETSMARAVTADRAG